MSKIKFILVLASIMMLVPMFAKGQTTEIKLFEVIGRSEVFGDNPLGTPNLRDKKPPQPTEFKARVVGNTLQVTSEAEKTANILVENSDGTTVLDDEFIDYTETELTQGSYTIEIQCNGLTLIGQFEVK